MRTYAIVGECLQQIGGECPEGWVVMQQQRPKEGSIAQADGSWAVPLQMVPASCTRRQGLLALLVFGFKRADIEAEIAAKAVLDDALSYCARDQWDVAYGSSGTIGAVGDVLVAAGNPPGVVTREGLDWLLDRLLKAGHADKLRLDGMREDRKAVIGGGLSVLRDIRALLPEESLLYLADSKYVPYGERDASFVAERTLQMTQWLEAQPSPSAVVAATPKNLRQLNARMYAEMMDFQLAQPMPGLEAWKRMALQDAAAVGSTVPTLTEQQWQAVYDAQRESQQSATEEALQDHVLRSGQVSAAQWQAMSDELVYVHALLGAEEVAERALRRSALTTDAAPVEALLRQNLAHAELFEAIQRLLPEDERFVYLISINAPLDARVYRPQVL